MDILVADYGRTKAEEAHILNHLAEQAKNHTGAASNFLLGDVSVDPDRYPSQRAYYLGNNNPTRDPNLLELIARRVNPGFVALQNGFEEWEEVHETFESEAENLKKGMNLLAVTDHSTLPDTGYVAAELAIRFGRLNDKELQRVMRVMIVMSKIVTFMGLDIPAEGKEAQEHGAKDYEYTLPETLSNLLCDDTLLSVPQAENVKESARLSAIKHFFHMFRSFTEIHNEAVVAKQEELFDKGGVVGTIAASGTRDKTLAEMRKTQAKFGGKAVLLDRKSGKPETHVVRLAPIKRGTGKMMMNENTKVWPIAVLMNRKVPLLKVCGIPRAVNTMEAADDVMRLIEDNLNRMDPTRSYEYFSYDELVRGGEISESKTAEAGY